MMPNCEILIQKADEQAENTLLPWFQSVVFHILSILGHIYTIPGYYQISMMIFKNSMIFFFLKIHDFSMIKVEKSGFHDFSRQKPFSMTFPDLCKPCL